MVWYGDWESMRLYAMVWDSTAMYEFQCYGMKCQCYAILWFMLEMFKVTVPFCVHI